ncbi:odorant receptor 46a-like [Leguminivora glycinivorella]|uniref:odorant receptor 46a-like n=1 Tax=Leguminivora glycinivorella TaxID=1035111 RepID=UPI00200BB7C8|nr:odorant receptor 46a-like [Leguminivora glycinivorella]
MKFPRDMRETLSFLTPFLPYGVLESWEDLNPRLYHAVHIYWLKFYGLWYNTHRPTSFYFWLHVVYATVVLWLVCFLPGIGELFYLHKRRDNIGDIAEGLYLFLSEMYTYIKLSAFWLKRKEIMALLEYLHRDEFKVKEPEHREILRRSIERARFVMTYYSSMCVGAVSVGILMPLAEHFEVLPTNVEYPYFDVYKSPAYGIIYIHHIYYKPATCIIDGVMDTILAAFIASAIGQIDVLAFNLRNFNQLAERRRKMLPFGVNNSVKLSSDDESRDCIRTVLKNIIKHHNSIIKYVSLIESAFSLASALQLMLSVMVLCLVGIQFLSIEEPSKHPIQIAWMAIYLTCMLIEVFIICWFGDELIWKSWELHQAAFESPWPSTDPKTAMFIVIFMERCKRPLRVTAGKIFTLSLDTYTNLINWSYKAFAVMRKMKK